MKKTKKYAKFEQSEKMEKIFTKLKKALKKVQDYIYQITTKNYIGNGCI